MPTTFRWIIVYFQCVRPIQPLQTPLLFLTIVVRRSNIICTYVFLCILTLTLSYCFLSYIIKNLYFVTKLKWTFFYIKLVSFMYCFWHIPLHIFIFLYFWSSPGLPHYRKYLFCIILDIQINSVPFFALKCNKKGTELICSLNDSVEKLLKIVKKIYQINNQVAFPFFIANEFIEFLKSMSFF